MTERIRLGIVGGGAAGSFGRVHRMAARLDDRFTLVAGALSSDPDRARAAGATLGLAPERCYADFGAMAEAEAARGDGVEAVAIVTPNHLHAAPAAAFLARGVDVICDKPLTATLAEAEALAAVATEAEAALFVTYTYSGYAMVRQAREIVAAGGIGRVRLLRVEYAQDWLAREPERGALWRGDPLRAGTGALGDIGTHAYHLARFVTGLEPAALSADLATLAPEGRVDDDVEVRLRFAGGARGTLWASRIAPGSANALTLRVWGETGGLAWAQEEPDDLWLTPLGEAPRRLRRGAAGAGAAAADVTRIGPGHPEGFIEAFATLYREAAEAIVARRAGRARPAGLLVPGLADGLEGMAFVDACLRSDAAGGAWTALAPASGEHPAAGPPRGPDAAGGRAVASAVARGPDPAPFSP